MRLAQHQLAHFPILAAVAVRTLSMNTHRSLLWLIPLTSCVVIGTASTDEIAEMLCH